MLTLNSWLKRSSNTAAAPHCHPRAVSREKGQFLLSLKTKMLKSFPLSFLPSSQTLFFSMAEIHFYYNWRRPKRTFYLNWKWTIPQGRTYRKSILPHQRPWKQHTCPEWAHRWGCEEPPSVTRHPWWWVSWQPSHEFWASFLKTYLQK